MSLKFTEKLCGMTVKGDTKFEKELTCRLEIYLRNLKNYDYKKHFRHVRQSYCSESIKTFPRKLPS